MRIIKSSCPLPQDNKITGIGTMSTCFCKNYKLFEKSYKC